jgi:kynurenine formamidase
MVRRFPVNDAIDQPAQPAQGNWGRWGRGDERGAANFITAERVLEAASLVRSGRVYSLSLPVQQQGVPIFPRRAPCLHFMTLDGGDYAAGLKRKAGYQSADDYISLPTHGTTHIDSLAHVWYDDHLYNGYLGSVVRSSGARKLGIEKLRQLVGRGVLLDLAAWKGVPHLAPGEVISGADLRACAAHQGVELRAGDIVLFRTGWQQLFKEQGSEVFFASEPGIGLDAARYLGELGIAGVGSDNYGIEAVPTENDEPAPVHRMLIRDYGVYLIELLALDELAADRRYEFMFVIAPLLITGGTGSPVNPLAIA